MAIWPFKRDNVTDRYQKRFAQDAMKISLALQVMKSTVAADKKNVFKRFIM